MKREVFEALLKDNGIELNENVKIDEIWKGVDTAIGGAVKNTRESTLEKMKDEALEAARQDYIKSLGIDGVENDNQLKAHISSLAANEDSQELIKLRTQFAEIEKEYGDYKSETSNYQQELSQLKNEKLVASRKPNVEADYLTYKINKLEGETFEDKLNLFVSDDSNKHYFEPTQPKVITTGKPKVVTGGGEISGVRQILIDQGKIKE